MSAPRNYVARDAGVFAFVAAMSLALVALAAPPQGYGGATPTLASVLAQGADANSTVITGVSRVETGAGTAADPAVEIGASGEGWYQSSNGQVNLSISGVGRLTFTASTLSGLGTMAMTGLKLDGGAKAASGSVVAAGSMNLWTDVGSSGTVTITLPASAGHGVVQRFVVTDNGINLDPQSGDKIISAAHTGLVDGEYLGSTTVGSSITLMSIGSDDWVVVAITGTWVEETP